MRTQPNRPLPHTIPCWLLAFCGSAPAVAAALSITDPGQGVFNFTGDAPELSGLAWFAGATYLAISDDADQRKGYELDIALDPATGRVLSAAVAASFELAVGYDLEGIAFCRPRGEWWVSDEGRHPAGGALRAHSLPDGKLLRELAIPAVMLKNRPNFGFESCAWGAGALWTTNEEALAHESALSTASTGTVVRLQRFDHRFEPAGQWAYETDSFGFDSSLTTAERSGVSELLALPDGSLLVLERTLGLGFIPSFRNRIYRVEFEGASEVSDIPNLDEAVHTRVGRTLLWERNMGSVSTRNFEGIALGPALPVIGPASFSLLLVADNGGGTQQHLYALVLHGLVPPSPGDAWRQCFWGSTAAEGPAADLADPDGDGIVNLLEYALGGDPLTTSTQPLPKLLRQDGLTALTFTRHPERTDITLTVQSATDPSGPWTDIAHSSQGGPMASSTPAVEVSETGEGLTRHVTVRELFSADTAAPRSQFMRLQVRRG
jgi:hypothetical protein